MATLIHETQTRTGWRIQAYVAGRRRSVWLGSCSERDARRIKAHVEAVHESRKLGTPLPGETRRWMDSLDARLHARLAPLFGSARSVSQSIDSYLEWVTTHRKPQTHRSYATVLEQLRSAIGHRQLWSLAAQDLDDWIARQNVSPSTVGKLSKVLRAWLAWSQDKGWCHGVRLNTPTTIQVGKKNYIELHLLRRWLESFRPAPQMQAALALAIYAGVRVPSEIVSLTRASVDWDAERLYVPDAKRTRRGSRGPPVIRETPLFPEVVEYLRPVWTVDGHPTDPLLPAIVAMGGDSFVRVCRERRDELGMNWPRLFSSVRATRETDLIRRFGLVAACKWIGNSPAIAARNYEQIPAETWREANAALSLNYDSAE